SFTYISNSITYALPACSGENIGLPSSIITTRVGKIQSVLRQCFGNVFPQIKGITHCIPFG
ncbi:hypothetical protein, partial [Ursidibacter sp. B-7004-1]